MTLSVRYIKINISLCILRFRCHFQHILSLVWIVARYYFHLDCAAASQSMLQSIRFSGVLCAPDISYYALKINLSRQNYTFQFFFIFRSRRAHRYCCPNRKYNLRQWPYGAFCKRFFVTRKLAKKKFGSIEESSHRAQCVADSHT